MGSIYRRGGSGGGSIYRRGGSGSYISGPAAAHYSPKGKAAVGGHHGHGFLHAVGSAVRNTGKAIEGIGPGLYETGKALGTDIAHHPEILSGVAPAVIAAESLAKGKPYNPLPVTTKKILKPTAQAYAHKYGPLAHGNFGEFAHRALVEDPLGTIADLATVATLGAGAAAKAGLLAEAPRSVLVRSPAALAGQEGAPVVERGIHGSQLSRTLRVQANKIAQKYPHLRVIGERAQYGRALKAQERSVTAGRQLKAVPYAKAMGKLPREQRIAAELLHDYPSPKLLEEHKAQLAERANAGDKIAAKQVKLLSNKKVLRYHAHPTDKMNAALAESSTLGEHSAQLADLSPETVLQRRYQPSLMVRGAKIDVVDESGKTGLVAPEGTTIPAMIDQLRSELQAGGHNEPIYRPHESVSTGRGTHVGAGGTSPNPRKPGNLSQNRGTLAAMGRVAHNVDTLTPAYMRVVRFATYKDRFDSLLASGQKLAAGEPLPEGWQYLRRSAAEKIPYTEATAGDFTRHLDELLGEQGGKIRDLLGTSSKEEAHVTGDGYRIIVPTRLVKQVTGEFERSNNVIARWFGKTTQVWRALVLNLRVGWLVNNLIGNTLMYTVKTAGAGGLRAYLAAMTDLHGVDWVMKHLIDDKQILSHLTPEDLAQVLPDQLQSFFGTQYQAGRFSATKVGKVVTAPPRILRNADIGYEQGLRRALANQLLRKSPEVKARLRAMPKETRNFRAAAKEELATNRVLADRISREINDALGQYDNMTGIEQRYIRAAVPFYGWFRAVSIVMAKMPLDNPLRTNILLNLGKLGEQYDADGYPYGGAIPLGGGRILKTSGLNPYATVPQLAPGLSTFAQAEVGKIPGTHLKQPQASDVGYAMSGFLNPVFSAPFGGGFAGVAQNLPETQLLFPKKPKHPEKSLYNDYGRREALLQYLGAPIRRLRKP